MDIMYYHNKDHHKVNISPLVLKTIIFLLLQHLHCMEYASFTTFLLSSGLIV